MPTISPASAVPWWRGWRCGAWAWWWYIPCSLTAVADWWACRLGQRFDAVRERLRDSYREADAKAGGHRRELDLGGCWAPWLGWMLDGWDGTLLAVALDATSLGGRFVVLAVSVLYRGCAVPVAWKILKAGERHPWGPEWLALLKRFQGVVPSGWRVAVLADRGLYAKWLFEGIVELGWHPLLRVNKGGCFRPEEHRNWRPCWETKPSLLAMAGCFPCPCVSMDSTRFARKRLSFCPWGRLRLSIRPFG